MSTVFCCRRRNNKPIMFRNSKLRPSICINWFFILSNPWSSNPNQLLVMFFWNDRSFTFPSHRIKRAISDCWRSSSVFRSKLSWNFVISGTSWVLKHLWLQILFLFKASWLKEPFVFEKTSKCLSIWIVFNCLFFSFDLIGSLESYSIHRFRFLTSIKRIHSSSSWLPWFELILFLFRISYS